MPVQLSCLPDHQAFLCSASAVAPLCPRHRVLHFRACAASARPLATIAASGAERVGVTHGYTAVLVRWLRERGVDAWTVPTRYEGELAEDDGNMTGSNLS